MDIVISLMILIEYNFKHKSLKVMREDVAKFRLGYTYLISARHIESEGSAVQFSNMIFHFKTRQAFNNYLLLYHTSLSSMYKHKQ